MRALVVHQLILLCMALAALSCRVSDPNQSGSQFSPGAWPKETRDQYLALQQGTGFHPQLRKSIGPQKSAVGSQIIIAGTSEPMAVRIGLEVLKHGGTAADAVVAASLAQVPLTAGAAISYAGMMTSVYYDAASGNVATLNASFNTVQGETDPLTIPKMGKPSGRAVLVPGFPAGIEALHKRFGKLPMSSLVEPALWIAENGVPLSPTVGGWIASQKAFITRLPEARRVFTKSNGELYGPGDRFQQPELAGTLREVARHGSAYMYTGDWARQFVSAVQAEGGKVTLKDMADYRPLWTEPARITYRDYDVVTLGPPNGAATTLLSLKLAENGAISHLGHYTSSPEALYYLIQASRVASMFFFLPPESLVSQFPDVDPSPAARLSNPTVEKLSAYIHRSDWPEMMVRLTAPRSGSGHSAALVAVDQWGNVASMLHSINTNLWGATGLFVKGVSIPDSASFQQERISRVGPGVRLPETTNPLLVLKDGKPVLASAAVGSALLQVTVQNLVNVLDFGMTPEKAVRQPNTEGPYLAFEDNQSTEPEYEKEAIRSGAFPPHVINGLQTRGQPVKTVSSHAQAGYWIGVQIDPRTGALRGAVTDLLPASVEAQ